MLQFNAIANLKRSKMTRENLIKSCLDKDQEINHLKNHSQMILMEVKKLKHKDISILKVDKETSMHASESNKFLEVETADKETLIDPIESRKFLEVEIVDKETSIGGIETENQSVITNEVLS
jgi:hypothetical protein